MVSDTHNSSSPLIVIISRFFLVSSFCATFVSFLFNSNLFLYIFIVSFLISLLHSAIHASTIQPVCPLYGVHTTKTVNRLTCVGHLMRMNNDRILKKIFNTNPDGVRRAGRPELRWEDRVD